jgi:hypothetical protein
MLQNILALNKQHHLLQQFLLQLQHGGVECIINSVFSLSLLKQHQRKVQQHHQLI